MNFSYHIGGSLAPSAPSYIRRSADQTLTAAIEAGEFCYIFNSRQMGKSSLLAQMQWQFSQQDYICTTLDMTRIGGEITTPTQWYKGIVLELWRGLKLRRELKLKDWWHDAEDISLLQNLSYFIEREILGRIDNKKIIIFIDEIDSVLSLGFAIDDLFALIRFCYNQRSINPEFNRLTFVLFGVAKPSDLIKDKTRTPFNIGRAIELGGLPIDSADLLTKGFGDRLSNSHLLLQEIFYWTGGQPFLTQKLCQLVSDALHSPDAIHACEQSPSAWLEELVQEKIIERWDVQDEPEHLRTIRDRLLRDEDHSGRLLGLYQQILQGEDVALGDIDDLSELLLSGLVVRQGDRFAVKNPIYAAVFNQDWVSHALQQLRPYAQALNQWFASTRTDNSRLLRGQTLAEAQDWAAGKRLSDEDYQFLAASVEGDRQLREQALEASRLQEVEARLAAEHRRLEQEQKNTKLQRSLLGLAGGALVLVSGLSVATWVQYRQTIQSERTAKIGKIQALIAASNNARLSNEQLDSMTKAIAAKDTFLDLDQPEELAELGDEVDLALSAAIYNTIEKNQLLAHDAGANIARMSPDSQLIATAGRDGQVKLWTAAGKQLTTLDNHNQSSLDLVWSNDSQTLWTVGFDGQAIAHNIRWQDNDLTTSTATTITEAQGLFSIALSPDNQLVVLGSRGALIGRSPTGEKLWQIPLGRNLAWNVAFTPDGQEIWISNENSIQRFSRDGQPLPQLLPTDIHDDLVFAIAFSPDGQTVATGSNDGTMKVWDRQTGTLLATMPHAKRVWSIAFSPDSQTLAVATGDGFVTLWTPDGSKLDEIAAHRTTVRSVTFSPDGKLLLSASRDGIVKIWQWQHPLRTVLQGHEDNVRAVAWRNDGQTLVTGGSDRTLRLWSLAGRQQQQWSTPGRGIWDVDFAPTGNQMAIASTNQINILDLNTDQVSSLEQTTSFTPKVQFIDEGRRLFYISEQDGFLLDFDSKSLETTLSGHTGQIWDVAIAADGMIATGSDDQTLRLWQPDGSPYKTINDVVGGGVRGLEFVPDGSAIASVTRNGTFKLWQIDDGTVRHDFNFDRKALEAIAIHPDGELFAVGGGDRYIELWKMADEKPQLLPFHNDNIFELQFSPDGRYLASSSADSNAVIWDIAAIRGLETFTYACDWAKDYLAIAPDTSNLCIN